MRGRVSAIVAAVVLSAWILGHAATADASCAGPSVGVDHTSVARGEVLEIRGLSFGTDCNDTGGKGPVLGTPQSSIALRIVQGDIALPLAVVDAARDYRFVVQVSVPAGLASGPAKVTASSSTLGEVSVAIVVTESAATVAASAPPTFVVGSDSALPRRGSPDSGNKQWMVVGGLALLVAAAIVGVLLYRRDQRRPYRWIQEPK